MNLAAGRHLYDRPLGGSCFQYLQGEIAHLLYHARHANIRDDTISWYNVHVMCVAEIVPAGATNSGTMVSSTVPA